MVDKGGGREGEGVGKNGPKLLPENNVGFANTQHTQHTGLN